MLVVGIFAVSFGSILARLAQAEGVPSLVIAAYRTLVATLILLPFMLTRHRDEVRAMTPGAWRLGASGWRGAGNAFCHLDYVAFLHVHCGFNGVGFDIAVVGGAGCAVFSGRTVYALVEDWHGVGADWHGDY